MAKKVKEIELDEDIDNVNSENDDEEDLRGVNFKCMDCGMIHKSTGIKHENIKVSYNSNRYMAVMRRYCLYCNSRRVSEVINRGKNKGLCQIEVMNKLCQYKQF